MAILIGILTVILVLDCIFLILLVLIQLPKKEAGIGMAFGGGATETLFGAGSGTVLTKATKYTAGLFMGLSLVLAVMGSHYARAERGGLDTELQKRAIRAAATPQLTSNSVTPPSVTPAATAPTSTTAVVPALQLTSTNAPAISSNPPAAASNAPAPPK